MSSDQHRSRHKHDATYAPSSASSSDHSDRGTTSHHSSSRRVLQHVLARKEREATKMHQLLSLTFAKLDEESQRATDAERRATECLVRAKSAIDARAHADADATAARAELAMYKVQLEQAQREISRAQELLDGLEARRHDAEEDAARARSVARKLQEARVIETAREEGKQQGWHEGLRHGRALGRREAENELRSRRREDAEDGLRSRSRRRGLGDPLFTQVTPITPQRGTSERSFPDDLHPRGVPDTEIPPIAPSPRSPELADLSSGPDRRHNHRTHDEESYDFHEQSPSPPRSRSRPRLEPLTPEPARSRPYTPHNDSTPSIIQPIPIPASASSIGPLPLPPSPSPSTVRHHSVRVPPDNWIPRAQDANGDGRLSIPLPPPHELGGPIHVPDGPYAITTTPEEGSPAVIPPPPIISPSRSLDDAYATPPPPDLRPVRTPIDPRSGDYVYSVTPPPPDLRPASRARDYASASLPPPPPPDLAPATDERAYLPPQRIAQITSNHSRASTRLSEFDLLAPVAQSRKPSNIGPPPAEEDELEYIDAAQTEPIHRQPIAPDPPLQRRRAHGTRPSRGPRRPRNLVLPAPLSQAAPQFSAQMQQQYMPQQHGTYMHPPQEQDVDDAPLHVAPASRRPKRSHTQSSIGINVESPSPESSPASSGNKSQRREDLLSPDHAGHHLPMPTIESYRPRTKPHPPLPIPYPQQEDHRPLAPLPELASLEPSFAPLSSGAPAGSTGKPRRRNAYGPGLAYEAAPLPDGMQYPTSPLQAVAYGVPGELGGGGRDATLSPLNVPSGIFGFKNRLRWRRNTTK